MQGGLAGHGLDKNELLLRKAQGLSDLAKLVAVLANFTTRSSFTNHLPHFEGEKVFGFAKQPVDCPPSRNKHSYHPNHVNFYHPWVFVLIPEPNFMKDVEIQQLPFGFSDLLPLLSQDGLELKKIFVLMASGVLYATHPNMQFNVLHSKKPWRSNAKQMSTFTYK